MGIWDNLGRAVTSFSEGAPRCYADAIKPVPNFPGYFASRSGHVWSTWKMGCKPDPDLGALRQVRPYTHQGGYSQVCLRLERARHKRYVHEIVLTTFKGPCPTNKDRCRHLNGNPSDNRPENLDWGTAHENNLDMIAHGTSRASRPPLSPHTVLEIRARHTPNSKTTRGNTRSLAQEYGIHISTLHGILTRKTWRHI